jgi:oxygen-independent coproporphyrinogen-3 oxidase
MATEAARAVNAYLGTIDETGVGFASREALSPREAALERLLMGLRTHEGVCWRDLTPLGLTGAAAATTGLAALGLIDVGDSRLRATAAGRPVLDRIIAELADG